MNEPGTKFDTFRSRIKNNPVVAAVMILGVIVISLSTFTDAAKNLSGLLIRETRLGINGEWTAEVTYPWRKDSYAEVFSFDGDNDAVHGAASFLGNEEVLLEGKIIEDRLEFTTKTMVYSSNWNDNAREVAELTYHGRVLEDEISFVLEIHGGSATGAPVTFTARKQASGSE